MVQIKSPFGLSNDALMSGVRTLVGTDRLTNATLVSWLAEVGKRRLHKPRYRSLYHFCVDDLHMSEPVAYKRVMAGRWARCYPVLLEAIVDGRLHLSAVMLIGPYLKPSNVGELTVAATHRSKAGIKAMLAERFPRPGVDTTRTAVVVSAPTITAAETPGEVSGDSIHIPTSSSLDFRAPVLDPDPVPDKAVTVLTRAPETYTTREPRSAEWIKLVTMIRASTDAKFLRAADMLSHEIPTGDFTDVLDRVLDLALPAIEKLKTGATDKPRAAKKSGDPSYVSPAAKRVVWMKCGGKCALCRSTRFLEIDHIIPVSKGGTSEPSNLRLLCRDCNRSEAERHFGAPFIEGKIERSGS